MNGKLMTKTTTRRPVAAVPRTLALTLALNLVLAATLTAPLAWAKDGQDHLPSLDIKVEEAMRAGLAAALRKLPKCNPYQMLENGECCGAGFVSLGKDCVRIAPPACASVAIDAPESCSITRCARFTRTIEKEVPALDDAGQPIPGKMDKKSEDVPCEPWVGGKRDLTCEQDTYECKPEEVKGAPRWCGDWMKEMTSLPNPDAPAGPVEKSYVRCKAGSDGCFLQERECTGKELVENKSEGAGPCKVGEYIDAASGVCSTYKCPAICQTSDGRCAKCGPDYQGAAVEFQKATNLDKRFYEAYFNLGMALERMGRWKEAVAVYEQAKAISPQDEHEKGLQLSAQAYIARAGLAESRRALEAGEKQKSQVLADNAKSVCESIRGVDPDNTMANVTLAIYYLDQGNLDLAEQFVRTALRANREDTIALNIRGLIKLKQGNNDIARWILEDKVLALDPANPEALANLGLAYVRLGDLPKAVVAFDRAVKLNPNAASARLNLGSIYLEYLNYRDAEKQYKAALALEPDNLEALTGYALSLEGKREPKKAAEIYEKVLAKDPTRNAILVRLALIYNNTPFNDGKKAIDYWKRYIAAVQLPKADEVKVALDAARLELKKFEKVAKKPAPDVAKARAAAIANEAALSLKWKNSIAIESRIQAIEGGMQLEQQAKDPKNAPQDPTAPK